MFTIDCVNNCTQSINGNDAVVCVPSIYARRNNANSSIENRNRFLIIALAIILCHQTICSFFFN